jgi:EpsI family protein
MRYFIVTAVILSATLGLSAWSARRVSQPLVRALDQLPSDVAGWQADHDLTLPASTLHALDPTSYLIRIYKKDPAQLELFIAFYAQQRSGESMHSPKHCLPGAGWEIWKQDSAIVPIHGTRVHINKYSIQNLGTRLLMLYWYQSAGRIVASEYMGKLLLAKDTLLTGRTAGSIVRITLPDEPGAANQGIKFVSAIIPEVQRCLTGQAEMAAAGPK